MATQVQKWAEIVFSIFKQKVLLNVLLPIIWSSNSFFFAKTSAQSFYKSSPMSRAKDLYTSGPHGLLSYFITAILVPAFLGFWMRAGPSSYPTDVNKSDTLHLCFARCCKFCFISGFIFESSSTDKSSSSCSRSKPAPRMSQYNCDRKSQGQR